MQTEHESVIAIKLFKTGDRVIFSGKEYTVNHVRVSKHDLFIKLDGYSDFVNSMDLEAKITLIPFKRD